jgi:hypothetical protein
MSTLSSENVTVFKVDYHAGDIPDTDIQQFKDELQEFGFVRVRGYRAPAAGTGAEIRILIEFIGLAAASGIIGHLAVKFYKKLSAKIFSFMKAPHPLRPTIEGIKISYDDLDIDIRYIDNNIIKNLSVIIDDVMNEL